MGTQTTATQNQKENRTMSIVTKTQVTVFCNECSTYIDITVADKLGAKQRVSAALGEIHTKHGWFVSWNRRVSMREALCPDCLDVAADAVAQTAADLTFDGK